MLSAFDTLSPSDPPVAVIVQDGTTETSVNQVLQVVAEEGDSAPTFTCSSDRWPAPTLSWGGQNRGMALPSGVSLIPSRQNLTLAWHRPLEYTDSGNYTCNATNSVWISSVRLELLVRRKYEFVSRVMLSNFSSNFFFYSFADLSGGEGGGGSTLIL